MITTVSFTDFRENLSEYLSLLARGNEIEINDAKKNQKLLTLVVKKEKDFDWNSYMKFIKNFKPVFTDEDVRGINKAKRATNKRLKELNW